MRRIFVKCTPRARPCLRRWRESSAWTGRPPSYTCVAWPADDKRVRGQDAQGVVGTERRGKEWEWEEVAGQTGRWPEEAPGGRGRHTSPPTEGPPRSPRGFSPQNKQPGPGRQLSPCLDASRHRLGLGPLRGEQRLRHGLRDGARGAVPVAADASLLPLPDPS